MQCGRVGQIVVREEVKAKHFTVQILNVIIFSFFSQVFFLRFFFRVSLWVRVRFDLAYAIVWSEKIQRHDVCYLVPTIALCLAQVIGHLNQRKKKTSQLLTMMHIYHESLATAYTCSSCLTTLLMMTAFMEKHWNLSFVLVMNCPR